MSGETVHQPLYIQHYITSVISQVDHASCLLVSLFLASRLAPSSLFVARLLSEGMMEALHQPIIGSQKQHAAFIRGNLHVQIYIYIYYNLEMLNESNISTYI